MMRIRLFSTVVALAAMLVLAQPANAQLPLGHYQPGVFPNASLGGVPPVSGIFGDEFFLNYSTSTTNGSNGQAITRQYTLPDGRTATLSSHVNQFTALTFLQGMTDVKILGARYGASMLIPVTNLCISEQLQLARRELGFTSNSMNLGDLGVYPITLGWQGKHDSTWFGYCLFIPSGAYRPRGLNNEGLGFFSHLLQVGRGQYLDPQNTWQLSGLLSYEINGHQQGSGTYVGNHLTFEYGLTKRLSEELSVGLTGYGQWQMTPTTGTLYSASATSSVVAVGGELTWQPKNTGGLQINLRGLQELASVNRFQGTVFNLNFAYPFAIYPDTDEKEPKSKGEPSKSEPKSQSEPSKRPPETSSPGKTAPDTAPPANGATPQ